MAKRNGKRKGRTQPPPPSGPDPSRGARAAAPSSPEARAAGPARFPVGSARASRDRERIRAVKLRDLIAAERAEIGERRKLLGEGPADPTPNLKGLSLSGGGIRSACFNLGFLEGLDRLAYPMPTGSGPGSARGAGPPEAGSRNHLELFDYVSSVSGGSYAAGNFATAMLDQPPELRDANGEPPKPEWLGNLSLASKTVPSWLWGLGVWFLGVAFQLLKTGSLLVCLLAMVAFVLRTLDSADATRFCGLFGLGSDVPRGFIPFWITLGVFLVGYWISVSKWRRWGTTVWFSYVFSLLAAYISVVCSNASDGLAIPDRPLSYWFQYACLLALIAPLVIALPLLLLRSVLRWFVRGPIRWLVLGPPRWLVLGPVLALGWVLRWLAHHPLKPLVSAARRFCLVPFKGTVRGAARAVTHAARWPFRIVGEAAGRSPRVGAVVGRLARCASGLRRFVVSPSARFGRWSWLAFVRWAGERRIRLRTALLVPMLVALFCIASLVTTGDIDLSLKPGVDAATRLESREKSRELVGTQELIYKSVLSALGVVSLAFFFPKKLFRSVRVLEDRDSGKEGVAPRGLKQRGIEPIYRVAVFLCSYGFVLLVIFVIYGLVAAENVSEYYEWREGLSSAALHPTDFLDWEQAWDQIVRDSKAGDLDHAWSGLASRLMQARGPEELSIEWERAETAEVLALESMPWLVRSFPWLMRLGPDRPWTDFAGFSPPRSPLSTDVAPPAGDLRSVDGIARMIRGWTLGTTGSVNLQGPASKLYDETFHQTWIQYKIARAIAESVLDDVKLHEQLTRRTLAAAIRALQEQGRGEEYIKTYKDLWERYQQRAATFASFDLGGGSDPARPKAMRAAIRNNNRRALKLYLGPLFRDRQDKVVWSSIVWAQDQWTRVRILAIAGVLWIFCCAVDVNSFSLQKFYREHVINSWVKLPRLRGAARWLHQTGPTYRGHEFGDNDAARRVRRRAPLLLINATLEGNRSLGDEPSLTDHIFTFSKVGSGSGASSYWVHGDHPEVSLARRSNLDIGNIVATSGAFLSPGTVANPALSAILHLLNIQTGYWVHDPGTFGARSPKESVKFHVHQSLGIDCEGDSRFMLTDGAHSENLGLYVLLQRRCRLIVVSDCSQQDKDQKPERRFDALIHVLQQARVDGIEVGPFLSPWAYPRWLRDRTIPGQVKHRTCLRPRSSGLDLVRPADSRPAQEPPPASTAATITITTAPTTRSDEAAKTAVSGGPLEEASVYSQEHCVFAEIAYPGSEGTGLLVYLRPTLTGDEGDSLLHGAADSRFPDDDPLDQFYTPAKMSTYRLLGRHIARELMEEPVMREALLRADWVRPEGGRPGTPPDPVEKPDPVPPCDHVCGEVDLSCLWRSPRGFRPARPPIRAGSRGVTEDQSAGMAGPGCNGVGAPAS